MLEAEFGPLMSSTLKVRLVHKTNVLLEATNNPLISSTLKARLVQSKMDQCLMSGTLVCGLGHKRILLEATNNPLISSTLKARLVQS